MILRYLKIHKSRKKYDTMMAVRGTCIFVHIDQQQTFKSSILICTSNLNLSASFRQFEENSIFISLLKNAHLCLQKKK